MSSPPKNPSSSMLMLQQHLAWKKRSSKPSVPVNKPNSAASTANINIINKSTSDIPQPEDEDEEYDPSQPNNYDILQIKFLKDEEARIAAQRDKPVNKSAKNSVPNLMNIIDLDD